jgi:hypothetical protein
VSGGADDETITYIRDRVAQEYDLPPAMAHRLHGDTLSALRRDAGRLRAELGLEPLEGDSGRERDQHGRFAPTQTMNERIRAASGR